MLSRCILFDCRQARVAEHHGAPGPTTGLMVQPVQIYVLVRCVLTSGVAARIQGKFGG